MVMQNSTRQEIPASVMETHFDRELGLFVPVPEGWQKTGNTFFKLLLVAPTRDDYETTCGFNTGNFPDASPDKLDELFAASRRQEERKYTNYRILRDEQITIDGSYALLRSYVWTNQRGTLRFVQMQAGFLGDNKVCVINGSCLQEHAATDLPLLEQIMRATRFASPTELMTAK
jgi:hypothetical protein